MRLYTGRNETGGEFEFLFMGTGDYIMIGGYDELTTVSFVKDGKPEERKLTIPEAILWVDEILEKI